ncbi:MFS transporter [Mycolicibacterium smegmatis]|uniref:MFS transporter n=1 Tax=Mycolicibacterium smegmatis TaxID=1772 RepID=UPI0005D79555|nr:MFS transporter [Mycolicibacterium smegmatis]MCP2626855.1 MFS transporter [Mycolicibacterium smegmatis]MDF1901104.1 MFS transporter [Mycolicibacterium smegmatis]MDF1907280.1 MFS transporter [Mycolicibacterium smegmatis]MDF1917552.1 MFS transporter [Mycolicibacterium smegmatis]MDF1925542.1 MFS transporter [Mycolicibacterium smegmatis]
MTALNDAERAAARVGLAARLPSWFPSWGFLSAVIAIGGMQLLATMDSTVAIVALPKIQDELSLSDAGRSWVITAYVLTFGGLMLLGGRLGDTIGRKRTFIVGVTLFTIASVLCGIAWNETTLVTARLLQGVGAAIASPTGLALVATTFPKGPARNAATAVFGAMTAIGSVMGLVVGGALTEVSWRWAFLVNVPIGLVMVYLARTALQETNRERMKLDAAGALLATLACTAAVFAFTQGPESGWLAPITLASGAAALVFGLAFLIAERNAENPVVPFALFRERNRVATFAAIFLAGGVLFTLTVLIGLYVQDILGYSALRAGVGFIPFVIGMGIGLGAASQLVRSIPPRVLVIAGGILVLGAMIYGSTLHRGIPYFPNLVLPITIGGIGIGTIVVPLTLSAIAGVNLDRIGPASAIALMLQNLGGPLVLAVIQAVITSRTLFLGGTTGPVKAMNDEQIGALDAAYTYGLLWVAAVAVLVGAAALFIGYTSQQVAHAQDVKDAMDAGEIEVDQPPIG